MLIDANTSLGPWPFSPIVERTGPELAAHLAANGIGRALVSHLGAVFLPEPMAANRRLFAAVRQAPSLIPIPIVNPGLANWPEQLAECRAAGVRAVKILPDFHNYRLSSPRVAEFMAAIGELGIRLILNQRYEDGRSKYFALRLKGVTVADLAAFLGRFPSHHVLLCNCYKQEILPLAEKHSNFSVELAFCEAFKTLEFLLARIPARRLVLGTNTPLLSTRGQVDKLRLAEIPTRAKRLIGADNIRRFLSL